MLVVLEATLLMIVGGAISLGIAWGVVMLGSRQWGDLRFRPDQALLGVGLMLVTGVACGVVPAIRAQRLGVVTALQSTRR